MQLIFALFSFYRVICGFGGALFVYTHRKMVEGIRRQQKLTEFLQRKFVYTPILLIIISNFNYFQTLSCFNFQPFHFPECGGFRHFFPVFSSGTWAVHGRRGKSTILANVQWIIVNIFLFIVVKNIGDYSMMFFWNYFV